ncbi:MAG: hypothetical protein RIB60_06095 [Phycisphaerales bacterium]
MGIYSDEIGHGDAGFAIRNKKARLYNRVGSAKTKGYVGAVDLTHTATETTGVNEGESSGALSNVRAAAAGDVLLGNCVVLLEQSLADDAIGYWQAGGEAKALVSKNSGNVAVGDPLYVGVSGQVGTLTTDASAGAARVGVAQEALTAPGDTGALCTVLFDGEPFRGSHNTTS